VANGWRLGQRSFESGPATGALRAMIGPVRALGFRVSATGQPVYPGRSLWLALLVLAVSACSSTPGPASKTYDLSVDFLQLAQGQCKAVSSFTNRYQEPIRISGDIRFLDRTGKRVSNVALMTETVAPGKKGRSTLSLMQVFSDADLTRCRSIASYQVKVSLCRTADGHYLDGPSCVGEFDGDLTW